MTAPAPAPKGSSGPGVLILMVGIFVAGLGAVTMFAGSNPALGLILLLVGVVVAAAGQWMSKC